MKMKNGQRIQKRHQIMFLVGNLLVSGIATASQLAFTPLVNLRWRHEQLNTLSANPNLDHDYSFDNLRERFGGDIRSDNLTLHVLAQGAQAYGLPRNSSFGAGGTYYANSG